MTQNLSSHPQLEDFLYAYTDTLLDGPVDVQALARQYDIPLHEVTEFTSLLDRMDATLVVAAPAPQFKRDLCAELIGEPTPSWLGRFRNLPPRLQFTAGVALLAAMALLGRRRFLGELSTGLQQLRDSQRTAEGQPSEAKISAG